MKNKLINSQLRTFFLLITSLLLGCGGGSSNSAIEKSNDTEQCAGQSLASGTSCMTLNNRDIIVYKPEGAMEGVAIFLHGAPGTPKKVSNIFNTKSISDSQKLLSVSPQGSDEFWGWDSMTDGRNSANEDVDFIVSLLAKIRSENNITSNKVYLFGYSAGGFMAYKLACKIPEQITALVSLAGQFRGDFSQCTTSTPITLHHFHSPQDTDVPMAGRGVGTIKSVTETLAHWRRINGCSEISANVEHPKVTSDSNGTETETWQGCVKSVSFSAMHNVQHEASYSADVLKEIYAPIFN